jgi:hypothetical protein
LASGLQKTWVGAMHNELLRTPSGCTMQQDHIPPRVVVRPRSSIMPRLARGQKAV